MIIESASVATTAVSCGISELREVGPSQVFYGRSQGAAVFVLRGHLRRARHRHGDAEVSVGNRHLCALARHSIC